MTFSEIFHNVVPYWGIEINFMDGEFIDLGEGDLGFSSNQFANLWKQVEQEVGYENSYNELMVWTMYQVFHKHAMQRFEEEIHYLRPQEIDIWEIEEQFFQNLSQPIWKKELAAYERV